MANKILASVSLDGVPDACFVVKQEHVLIRISFNRKIGLTEGVSASAEQNKYLSLKEGPCMWKV